MVSYEHKHNEANGERNRDGTDNNRSANYGVEGPTDDPAIGTIRTRQARNIAATLLLSTGTPMLTMGDEIWRTQQGNNNAYCQDNAVSWVDWSDIRSVRQNMLAFVRRVTALRAESPALRQGEFFEGRAAGRRGRRARPGLVQPARQPDDRRRLVRSGRVRTLQMWLDGAGRPRTQLASGRRSPTIPGCWCCTPTPDPIEITLPGPPYGEAYTPVLDTVQPDR